MFAVDKFEKMGDDLCFGLVSWKWGLTTGDQVVDLSIVLLECTIECAPSKERRHS